LIIRRRPSILKRLGVPATAFGGITMSMGTVARVLTVAFLAVGTLVFAEDKFGVAVYPGAKPDTATAAAVKKMMSAADVACYRSPDTVDKVVAFYKKQTNLTEIGTTAEGGMFKKKGDAGVSMTVQSPWMDMTTGKMMKDTLISLVKR
jgi:hypothetical protein